MYTMLQEELQRSWALVSAYRLAPKNGDGILRKGERVKLMATYNKTAAQYKRIVMLLKRADKQGVNLDLSDHRKLNQGRPSEITPEIEAAMKKINRENLQKKINSTRRRMQLALQKKGFKLSLRTVHRYIDLLKGKISPWSVKPSLSAKQKTDRLAFIAKQEVRGTKRVYRSVNNDVHVDEKWFFMILVKGVLLLFPEDELPPTFAQHKNNIVRVMFLCAVGKPQLRPDGTRMNGLIACIPFTEFVTAQRSSKHRPRGTIEEKPIPVDSKVYREAMTKVFSLIQKRFKDKKGELITVQHDGATSHNGHGNKEFFDSLGQKGGWNIVMVTQSAQSPDLNILDIGVFRSMQSRSEEYRMESNTVSDLVARVKKTFVTYPSQLLDSCWAVLHEHYRLIRMEDGGNTYCNPHAGIRHRVSKGLDPVNYSIDFDDGDDADD